MQSILYCRPALIKTGMYRFFFVKFSNMKFHEIGSEVPKLSNSNRQMKRQTSPVAIKHLAMKKFRRMETDLQAFLTSTFHGRD
jgi:hypothetical protein